MSDKRMAPDQKAAHELQRKTPGLKYQKALNQIRDEWAARIAARRHISLEEARDVLTRRMRSAVTRNPRRSHD